MRKILHDPPRWLLALWLGLVGGVGVGIFVKTDGQSWTSSGVAAACGTVVFAIGAWVFEPSWKRQAQDLRRNLSDEDLRTANRAAVRGPIPTDPDIRAAALRIARHTLRRRRGQPGPKLTAALGCVMAINTIVATVSHSWWAIPAAVSAATMLYSGWYLPRLLRRRIPLLSGEADDPID